MAITGLISVVSSISSQFVSALLLAAPFAVNPMKIRLVEAETVADIAHIAPISAFSSSGVVSETYIDMTLEMLRRFGVDVVKLDAFTVHPYANIPQCIAVILIMTSVSCVSVLQYNVTPCMYSSPNIYNIEGDATSASSSLAIAAISLTLEVRPVTVSNVGRDSLQGIHQTFINTLNISYIVHIFDYLQ